MVKWGGQLSPGITQRLGLQKLPARAGFSTGQIISPTSQHQCFINSTPGSGSSHCLVTGSEQVCSALQPPPSLSQEVRGSHSRKVSILAWLLLEEDAGGAADAGLQTFFLLLTDNGRISARFVWR